MACSVCCEASSRICSQCFAGSCAGRQADRSSLVEQRDAARQQLERQLEGKLAHQRQQLQLRGLAEELQATRQRTTEAQRQLAAVVRRAQQGRAEAQARQQRLREAQHELAALSRQLQALAAQHRQQKGQACLRGMEALAREQRTKVVRRVMDILPLTLAPHAAADGGPERAAAAICGLPLPDGRAGGEELARLSRSLGGALGYLALLLDLLSRFLQLPLAHRAAFQGSTSRLWQPDGFFDTRASPPNDALRLCWSGGGDGGGGTAAQQAQQAQRAEAQLAAALGALRRSAGMLVYARLGPQAALRVPQDRSPFTWLAKLCSLLAAEPRGPGGRPGAPDARSLAASAVLGRGVHEPGGGGAHSLLFQDGGAAEDAAEEEWEHLPHAADGMLPPRPWESVDVEHWEQANFGDGGGGGGGSSGGLGLYGSVRLAAAARRALSSLRSHLGGGTLAGGGG